jgi:iron complex transport system substrate-binding protein
LRAHRTKWGVFALFLSLILVLAACGGSGSSENNGGDKEETTDAAKSESEGTRVVEHALGKTEIPEKPERVVALTNGASDMAIALGLTPVGAVQHWGGDPWFNYLKDDLKDTEMLGLETQPNLEKIAALEPDLILASKLRHEKIYDKLSQIAPTVTTESVGIWKEELPLYAEAMYREDKGEELIANWENRVADFKEKMGDRLSTTEVSVVRFMPGKVRIMLNGFPGTILDELGLARPESQQGDEFAIEATEEQIPKMDGDYIFYLTYETGDGKGLDVEEEWINKSLWQNLSAVKKDHVYKVSDATWNSAGGILAANKMLDDLYKYLLDEEK